jgi:hypothetical protein
MPLYMSAPNSPEYASLLTSGEETMLRDCIASSGVSATTGNLRLSYFQARKTETTTQVRISTGGTAAAATPTLCRIGLYSIAASGDGTLVASTVNDTTLFAAVNTAYLRSWSSSYAKSAGLWYALGVLVVSGAATPTFLGTTAVTPSELAISPRLTGNIGSQADLPSSFTAGSLTTTGSRIYAAILP